MAKKQNKEKSQNIYKTSGSRVDFKNNLKTYFNFVKEYKLYFLGIILFVTIGELTKVGEKYLFKLVVDNGTLFASGSLLRDYFLQILIYIGIVYVVLIITKIVFQALRMYLINIMEASMILSLKRKFFNHIIHLSHSFHTTHKTGSLISRLTRGSRAIERMTDFLVFDTLGLLIQTIFVASALLYFDKISAIVILLTALSFIAFSLFISYIQQKANLNANNAEDREKGNIADIFLNIDSIKYFGKESNIKSKYEKLATTTKDLFVKLWHYAIWHELGQSIILGIGTFFLIYFPLLKLLNGEIGVGTLAFIYTAYLSLMGPLFGFVYGIRKFYVALGDLDSLYEYDKIKNDIVDKTGAENLKVRQGEVEFKNVIFNYGKKRIIDSLSLKIKPNEKVALVGHSGSGKTTLVKLLYRFYDVGTGEILIDGKNIRDVKQESLRSELSIVPQEAILFDDTIYSNIIFSKPSANRKDVMRAMKAAHLDRFVFELPHREKTIVGERGIRLSGGEKQRVSIARALLADKKILVLDEATSALDSKTEFEIQRDLAKLMEGRTSIIIAHRLSTIMNADKIVVLKKGKIVQIGKHSDLINREGVYKELWNLQKGGYIGK